MQERSLEGEGSELKRRKESPDVGTAKDVVVKVCARGRGFPRAVMTHLVCVSDPPPNNGWRGDTLCV